MKLEAIVGGKTYQIDREELASGRFRMLLVGEDPVEVDVRRVEEDVWSLIINGQSFEATVQRVNGKCHVSLRGTTWEMELYDPRRRPPPVAEAAAVQGKQVIVSPMPGRVVRVPVAVGDQVESGQGVIVIEAMKMENELTATAPGIVKEIRVGEGMAVEDKQALMVIE